MSRLLPCAIVFCLCAPVIADEPGSAGPKDPFTPQAISRAVTNLGSPSFAVRERATRFLWQAGRMAEAGLEEAAKGSDPEVIRRAESLLARFRWGIYPDTPAEVVKLIERFRAGDVDARRDAAKELVQLGDAGYAALPKVLSRVDPEARDQLFAGLLFDLRERIPELIVNGRTDTVGQLLGLTVLGPSLDAARDYAAYQLLTGNLEAVIGRHEAEFAEAEGQERRRLAYLLTHLYRAQRDWASAKKFAQLSGDEELRGAVLWEADDWEGLSEWSAKQPPGSFGNDLGVRLGYHRLAGAEEKVQDTLKLIHSQFERAEGQADFYEFRGQLEGLLLNRYIDDSMRVLREHKQEMGFLFDLLTTQLRYEDAMDLVDSTRDDELLSEGEKFELTLRRARALYSLGEGEAARQLFSQLIDKVNRDNDWSFAARLVHEEMSVGANDLALAHAAECLEILHRRDGFATPGEVLKPLFGKDAEAAATWWDELRRLEPDLTGIARLKVVKEILTGEVEAGRLAAWAARMDLAGRTTWPRHRALAVAHRACEAFETSEGYYRSAAELADGPDSRMALADFLAERGRHRDAADQYGKAWKSDPTKPLPLLLQGVTVRRMGDQVTGERLVRAAHMIPLGSAELRAELIQELGERGLAEEARQELDLAMRVCWYDHWSMGNVLNRAARQAIAEGRFEEASRLFEKSAIGCMRSGASFIQPSAYLVVPQEVIENKARARIAEGKFDEAYDLAEEGLRVLPGNIDLAIALVPELAKREKTAEADRLFRRVWDRYVKICERYPDSAWALNSAAWMAANCRLELDAALNYAQRAVELMPDHSGYLDTLAEVHFRRGEQDEAIGLMRRCIELDDSNQYYLAQLERFRKGDITSPVPEQD